VDLEPPNITYTWQQLGAQNAQKELEEGKGIFKDFNENLIRIESLYEAGQLY